MSASLLTQATQIAQIRAGQTPHPALVQALAAETPDSPEYVQAMDQLSIRDSLQVILSKGMQEQHRERFLPSLDDFLAEYADEVDKLGKLLADARLELDDTAIQARVEKYQNQGLASVISGQARDVHGNIRGDVSATDRFADQYVGEIIELIGGAFVIWQESGDITDQRFIDRLDTSALPCDWRIFRTGVEQHFAQNYTCAVHVLIPQFENIVRHWAQSREITTKSVKNGVESEMLLNDLLRPENTALRAEMGIGQFDLAYRYLVRSAGPFNYRNSVAHGWIVPEQYEAGCVSAMVIWLVLKLLSK